jgi:hypothetical protein
VNISYHFRFKDGTRERVDVDIHRSAPDTSGTLPEWTRLGRSQCPNCPLKAEQHTHCPAAVDLAPTISAFAPIISHQEARVEVETPERSVSRDCQVQQALSSLVGLIMATSGCPILGRMRGLAMTHLPFSTLEEMLFRNVGAYLILQFQIYKQGGEPDWDLKGLSEHFARLEVLNKAFKKRIDAAARQDATINAVSALGVLSMGIGLSIDDQLAELGAFAMAPA